MTSAKLPRCLTLLAVDSLGWWLAKHLHKISHVKDPMLERHSLISQVESLSDCPEHKQLPDAAVDETVPSYYRFFHADKVSGDKKPHMCCKLSYTSIFDIKGFKYKRC